MDADSIGYDWTRHLAYHKEIKRGLSKTLISIVQKSITRTDNYCP